MPEKSYRLKSLRNEYSVFDKPQAGRKSIEMVSAFICMSENLEFWKKMHSDKNTVRGFIFFQKGRLNGEHDVYLYDV